MQMVRHSRFRILLAYIKIGRTMWIKFKIYYWYVQKYSVNDLSNIFPMHTIDWTYHEIFNKFVIIKIYE